MLRLFTKWLKDENANAAIEAGLLFPVMVSMLLGMVDIGVGLLISQKVINSSHMISDLLARQDDINNNEFNDSVVAGQLILGPFSVASMGYDVAGVQYIGINKTPTVQWRDTFNMSANTDIMLGAADLGAQNEGVLAVTVRYVYTPIFSGIVSGDIIIQEESYARGRRGLFVTRTRV